MSEAREGGTARTGPRGPAPTLLGLIGDGARFVAAARSTALILALGLLAGAPRVWAPDWPTGARLIVSFVIYVQLVVSVAQAREAMTGSLVVAPRDWLSGVILAATLFAALTLGFMAASITLGGLGLAATDSSLPLTALVFMPFLLTPVALLAATLASGDKLVPLRLARQSGAFWGVCLGLTLISLAPPLIETLTAPPEGEARDILVSLLANGASALVDATLNAALAFLYIREARAIA